MKKSHIEIVSTAHSFPHDPSHIAVVDNALPDGLKSAFPNRIEVDAGEGLKTFQSIESLAEEVLAARSERPLTLVAVGGGSIGDAVGFLASVLWRGVNLVHVPTTLLAMIDSAHGGKTAINLGTAKNQIGSFYPADAVYIVREIIDTLPHALRQEGLAEIVKASWLDGTSFVESVEQTDWWNTDALIPMIQRAVAFKTEVVAKDPYDREGVRIQLNLGHTCAHAIERTAGLSHGESVAWGLMSTAFVSPLAENDRARLLRSAAALVRPVASLRQIDPTAFQHAIARDKKREAGALRSIVLDAPGAWRITTAVTPQEWWAALQKAIGFVDGPARLEKTATPDISITLPRSKSEMIRALMLDHSIDASPCDDVWFTNRALREWSNDTKPIGEGATPFRFLAVRAAFLRPQQTVFELGETLNRRNHDALVEALRQNGITARHHRDNATFTIDAGPRPSVATLDAQDHKTSQIASAFLLLQPLGIEVSIESAGIASEPYFDMTRQMIADGSEPEADASAHAFWIIANRLGASVVVENPPLAQRQPDHRVEALIERAERGEPVSLRDCPDLAPVLAAWSVVSGNEMTVVDAAHLRNKESDRIEDLALSLRGVGVDITTRDDGFTIKRSETTGGAFCTYGDHRLAMCAALLSIAAPITIDDAGCVSKSYPQFWQDVRRAGWCVDHG